MRMNALWWWIDRWRKSTAYMDMTLEQQGAYRNLLDEATLRGGPLPDDERILAKASGDARSWKRVRNAVMARFKLAEDGWHNETLDEVLRQSVRRAEKQANYRSRQRNEGGNGSGNNQGNKPGYPDPDLSVQENPPLPPSVEGGGSLQRVTRKERDWAEALFQSIGHCPHSEPCRSDYFCQGRLIEERRADETNGRKVGAA